MSKKKKKKSLSTKEQHVINFEPSGFIPTSHHKQDEAITEEESMTFITHHDADGSRKV